MFARKKIHEKADSAKVSAVNDAIAKLKDALKGGDTEAIKKATEALQKPLYELSAQAYQQAGPQAGAQGAAGAQQQAGGASEQKKDDDNVVDAEYTDVKDDKK